MNTLRSQHLFIGFLTVSSIFTLSFFSFQSYKKISHMQQQTALSLDLEHILVQISPLPYKKKVFKRLNTLKKLVEPELKTPLSHIIHAYKNRNAQLFHKRHREFHRHAVDYRIDLYKKRADAEAHTLFYALGALSFSCFSILFLVFFARKHFFQPLTLLLKEMDDFSNNQYSFQFSTPVPNEVGKLQATFHSLAEKSVNTVDELKALDEAKSDFLSIASHELRTPLTSLKGSLSLLGKGVVGQLDEKAQNLVSIAETETDRLIRLINDILDLAKIEAQEMPVEMAWTSLKNFIYSTFEGLQGLKESAGVALVMDSIPETLEIYADEDRLKQVLTNLISNAIKHSPLQGIVNVGVAMTSEEGIMIYVKDQGCGIAPEDQEKIFEKFRQATGPNSPLVKGTGLGLAIVKALIEQHNGQIGVNSQLGEGSTFYFILPQYRISISADEEDHAA